MADPGKALPSDVPDCDVRPLWDVWLSVFQLPALTVADEIGIFALLADGPETAASVAERTGISGRASDALLGLLAALGYLRKEDRVFSLTDLSRTYLLPSSPYYWGGVLHSVKDMPVSHAMIMEAVRRDGDGSGLLVRKFTDDWGSSDQDLRKARSFTAKMHSHGVVAARSLARAPYFTGARRLLDVGGGSGCYSIALASAHPDMSCTIAELPAVCPVTQEYIDRSGCADRVRVVPLDMFKDRWPEGHDALLISDILHDWGQEACRTIVGQAFDSLASGGRIFVHEALLDDDGPGPLTVSAYSMAMLMVTQGRQFEAEELRDLLASAGFRDIDVMPAHGYYSLVTGRKP